MDDFFSMIGLDPDPWQSRVVLEGAKSVMLKGDRRVGKTTICAAAAAKVLVDNPTAKVLLLSGVGEVPARDLRDRTEEFLAIHARSGGAKQDWLANGPIYAMGTNEPERLRGYFGRFDFVVVDDADHVRDIEYDHIAVLIKPATGRLLLTTSALKGAFARWIWDDALRSGEWNCELVGAEDCTRIPSADWRRYKVA